MPWLQTILGMPFSIRQIREAKKRNKIAKETFVSEIVREGGDSDAANILYEKLKEWVITEELSPYPNDNLEYLYGIAEEELDEDIIFDIFNILNIPNPSESTMKDFGFVCTPCDVAKLIKSSKNSVS
jgi:hypothetical protein